jgi:hypothetical protein
MSMTIAKSEKVRMILDASKSTVRTQEEESLAERSG